MMDEERGSPSLDVAQESGTTDAAIRLAREELLLAGAEASASDEGREAAWLEAIARMLRAAAALRSQVAAGAAALVEEAQRERSRIAAEVDGLRAETSVLREEIEVLRAERDLCYVLAVEAGSAVAGHLAQWRQLHSAPQNAAVASATPPHDVPDLIPRLPGAPEQSDPAIPIAGSLPHLDALSGARVAVEAGKAVPSLALTVSALPGLLPLFDLEWGLAQLPNVKSCSVRSVRQDTATVDIVLHPPTAATIVAAALLGLPKARLVLESIAEQQIVARFAPGR